MKPLVAQHMTGAYKDRWACGDGHEARVGRIMQNGNEDRLTSRGGFEGCASRTRRVVNETRCSTWQPLIQASTVPRGHALGKRT